VVLMAAALVASPAEAQISVACALPFDRGWGSDDDGRFFDFGGDNDSSCSDKHKIVVSTTGTTPDAEVEIELLGLDAAGNLIKGMPVQNGDTVHMASRVSPNAFRMATNAKKRAHTVFAPIPLLKVTVKDQGQTAEAYCSNIPYLDVLFADRRGDRIGGQRHAGAGRDSTHRPEHRRAARR
jgi:hypothetical protein